MSDFLTKISFLYETKRLIDDRRVRRKNELTAISRILPRTIAEISSGVKSF
jgi:hypothetical protein